jgi:hypothetical protein
MTKTKLPKTLEGVDLGKLREFVVEYGGDAWTIWKAGKFTEMGFKADDLPVDLHRITDSETGEVGDLTGVWNLDMMFRLAGIFNAEFAAYTGRGFQARAIRDAVLSKLDQLISTEKENTP